MTTKTIEYVVMIVEASHLILHIKEDSIYKRNGNHLLGAVVSKMESTEVNESSLEPLLDAALCFSDEKIKKVLDECKINELYTSDYSYFERNTNPKQFKKFSGVKLLVQEIEIVDYREDNIDEDYNTKSDLFNPMYYDPDEWEFILKVKQVLPCLE